MKSFITTLGKIIKLDTERDGAEANFDQNKKGLVIPLYQREYKWTTEQVETLLRDVNSRDKFLGLIILDEKNDHYEVVDGQQRLTTCLISLIALFNSYDGLRREQATVLPYILRGERLVIENDSVKSYFEKYEGLFSLSIKDEDDVYYQKNDFERVFGVASEFITNLGQIENRKEFFRKLLTSKMLVFINDSDDNIRPIEQMFLDINEKTQKLDSENIFKGHCFEIFTEEGYQDLREKWVELKKVAMKFVQRFHYRDMGQYLYLYLLKDGLIPENMAPKGKHYLEGKSIDETEALLDAMITYGQVLTEFDDNIHCDTYCFRDFTEDCFIHRNDNDDIWVMRMMSQNLLESTGAWNQKFPMMHFVANKSKLVGALTHADLRKILSALYMYSNLFVLKSGKKSKVNIDRTIIQEMEQESVNIPHLVDLTIKLRNDELEDFEIPDTSNFDILVFIYSVIDYYSKSTKFLTRLYSKEKNYNLEHFIIPKRTTGTIDWVVSWKQNRNGKRVPNAKKILIDKDYARTCRKKTTDYLIINDDLNGDMQSFDVIQKVDAIVEWHNARNMELPKHLQLYFDHLSTMDSYNQLRDFKSQGIEDVEIIQPVYEKFLRDYFDDIEMKEKLQRAFFEVF